MDWKDDALNQDTDVLTFLVGKTLVVLSLDVIQALYTKEYEKFLWKPIKLGSVLAYEILYVRLNREILNSALSISVFNTKRLSSSGSVVRPDESSACSTGFDNEGKHTLNVENVRDYDNNRQTRMLNMGFYSLLINTILSGLDGVISMKGAGYDLSTIQQYLQPPIIPIQIMNPLYPLNQVPLPLAQQVESASQDVVTNSLRLSKFGISGGSSLALYIWLWYKNMNETNKFKCPVDPSPQQTL